ncbi:hypothetical protein ACH5RR_026069 [Cinchona calisaya]|uniref:Uncharacterized protein n=1 Tax=Cinchona calisaya TaxID=153742 RepID=A0ABD2Z4P7_9GENT
MPRARAILLHLQKLYGEKIRSIRYEISRKLFRYKMAECLDMDKHILNMIRLTERLESLNFFMEADLQDDLILQSLSSSFSQFIINYHVTKKEHTLAKLLKVLTLAQKEMKGKARRCSHC